MARNFIDGKPSREIFFFALPILFSNVFQQFYNIVDSAIVGRLISSDALGAVGASFPVIFAATSLISGIGSGFTVVVSQYFGANKIKKVKATISTMYFFLFGMGFIVSLLSIVFSKQIFTLVDLPENLLPQATAYFNILMAGLVLFFSYSGTTAILNGLGDSKTPLYFMIFSTLLNISFDFVFVYFLGFGVEGVAYATLLSQAIALAALILYVHQKNSLVRLRFSDITFDREIFHQALRIGLPSGIQMVAVSIGMVVISRLVNGYGTAVIAGYSVAMRIESMAVMPSMAYSQALASFTGQNMGAGKLNRVYAGYKTALLQSFAICMLMTAVIVLFGADLMRVFTTDTEIIKVGTEYLVIVSSFYTLFVFLFSANGTLRGAGDTLIPMFITIVALWIVRIPTAFYLSQFWAEKGIWWSIPVGWAIGAICSTAYLFSGRWKNKGIVKN